MSLEIKIFGQVENKDLSDLDLVLLKISGDFKRKVRIHEIYYKPARETEFGPRRNDDVVLILKRNIVTKKVYFIQKNQIEVGSKNLGNHRIVNECEISGNAMEFVEQLGYEYFIAYPRFWYEVYRTGFEFAFSDMTVSYFKYYKLGSKLDLSTRIPLQDDNTWIVEACFPKSTQDQLANSSNSLFSLAKQLSTIVELSPVDHTLLQTRLVYSD